MHWHFNQWQIGNKDTTMLLWYTCTQCNSLCYNTAPMYRAVLGLFSKLMCKVIMFTLQKKPKQTNNKQTSIKVVFPLI